MEVNISLTYSIIFGILMTMIIPSMICSLFIFYHFARFPQIRKKLNNHVILALLVVNFIQVIIDMPLTLITLRTGFVFIQTHVFCKFWLVCNYAVCVSGLMLMFYGCIERYFLVFHRAFFKKHLILLHYGPLLLFVIYPPLLYIGLIVIYPCETYFDYTQFTCGGSCYQYQVVLGLYDWFCNIFAPIAVSAVATMILIIRVLLQKRRVGQRAIWQRNRKMVLQLASVSVMYIIVWMPIIVGFVYPLIVPNPFILELASNMFIYFEYISCLLCPFMSLIGLPEIWKSIKKIFSRFNIIQPTI